MKSFALFVLVIAGCKNDCPTCPPAQSHEAAHPSAPPMATPLPASADQLPAGVNAVQNEMRLLHEAMRDSVTAIAMGTLSTIPERLHVVHRAKGLTEKALETGTYTLPKNPGEVAAFKALDESFHDELVKLLQAAKSNDATATATALGNVMGRCEGCHTQFRATPAKSL